MKNIFTPVFLVTLVFLYGAHVLVPGPDTAAVVISFLPFILFAAGVGAFVSKKPGRIKVSYILVALSLSLLITAQFIREKTEFNEVAGSLTDIPVKEYITLRGTLTDYPEIGTEFSTVYLDVNTMEYQQKQIHKKFLVRVKVKGDLRRFNRGDMVVMSARIYPNRISENFYPGGMKDYILYRKLHFNGYCKSDRMVELEMDSGVVWRIIGGWRNRIREVIEGRYRDIDGGMEFGGVFLEAILLGERGRLGVEDEERLLDAGVFHLLAISGAHIGIIALFSLLLLKSLGLSFRKRYVVTALILVLFLILSGFRVSAERAVLMALLIFTARFFLLEIEIFNIISFAGLLILIWNPAQFLDAGFILTFALTAAIVIGRNIFLFSNSKSEVFAGSRGGFFKKSPLPPEASKIKIYLIELLAANLSASLISLPLSLYFFKRYAFAGFFAGLLLLPLTAVITAMGMLLIPLALLSVELSRLLLIVLDIPLWLFFKIVSFFSGFSDVLTIYRASPSLIWVVIVLAAFYVSSLKLSKTWRIAAGSLVLAGLVFISINLFYYVPKNLEVYYLDVGQGDSEVVVFPGGDALLIDAGGAYYSDYRVGRAVVLPFLLQKKINVKWIAVSHFHPDHANGVAEIIHILKPDELWISAEAPGDESYDRLMRGLPESVRVEKLHAPFVKRVSGCEVELLYPFEIRTSVRPRNNDSQVMKITDSYRSFLFTGDIEREVEQVLVEKACSTLKASVIKAAHHGSRTSSSVEFLKCVGPEWAIFSYAWNNRFNFPHREVIRNFKGTGIKYLSTARCGGIKVESCPERIRIEVSK
jgi:competence protein ComEC